MKSEFNSNPYIDLYAQIRQNVVKESVGLKRYLFLMHDEINIQQQLMRNKISWDVENDKFNGDRSL